MLGGNVSWLSHLGKESWSLVGQLAPRSGTLHYCIITLHKKSKLSTHTGGWYLGWYATSNSVLKCQKSFWLESWTAAAVILILRIPGCFSFPEMIKVYEGDYESQVASFHSVPSHFLYAVECQEIYLDPASSLSKETSTRSKLVVVSSN